MSEALKTPEPQAEQNVSAAEEQQPTADASPQVEKKTPGKRTRLSFIERAQKESEELVKNLGGSLEMEGGRRTRSSARGTPTRPVATPPPAKKSRNSPASPKAATPRGRGRGRKLDTSVTPEPPESKEKTEPEVEKNEEPAAEKEAAEPEKSTKAEEKPAEDAKSKESSETNGPEKTEAEHVDDAPEKVEQPAAAEKSAPAEEKSAETPAAAVAAAAEDSKPTTDQVDASNSEAAQPEKSSQPAVAESKSETAKLEGSASEPAVIAIADSPMEVDEHSNSAAASSKANEQVAAAKAPEASSEPVVAEKPAAVETVVEKEPTPEPMEVDSSSKSSDVVECIDIVDKSEEETVVAAAAATAQIQSNTTLNDVESSTNSHDEKPAETVAVVPSAPAAENNLKSEINANVTAKDIPAVVKSIEEPVAVGEPHVDNNKNENDVDQQKLAAAASQLNAASGAGDAPVNAIPTSL